MVYIETKVMNPEVESKLPALLYLKQHDRKTLSTFLSLFK
jgi:hypothetical protein